MTYMKISGMGHRLWHCIIDAVCKEIREGCDQSSVIRSSITLTSVIRRLLATGQIFDVQIFDKIIGYEAIKRTLVRSLNSEEPVHILLAGPPGQAKTLFLKCTGDIRREKSILYCRR
jgi:SpoVK/Ycf46/Vps4 family AAA+-type ATPase